MILETFSSGPCDTNTYVVGCQKTKKAFVVDVPPDSVFRITQILAKHSLVLERILLTHSHWDHIGGVSELKESTDAPVWVHALDAENVKKPGSDGLPLFFSIKGCIPDGFLKEGDLFSVGSIEVQVLETPGHTPGGVSFYLPQEKILFSGDTLFKGTMGRIDFPGSSPNKMWHSLERLGTLPLETKVYSGHGPFTYLKQERWICAAKEKFGSS